MPPSGPNPTIKVPKFKTMEIEGMKMLSAKSNE
jgi:hypothetical protein